MPPPDQHQAGEEQINAELLHNAADVVAEQGEPQDAGFAPDALDLFLDESTFLREIPGGTSEVGIHRGSLAYGIAVGVEAARLAAHSERERANKLERELEMRDEQMLLSGEAGVEWPRYQAERERAERAEMRVTELAARVGELEDELAIPVPRRGHYADLEVVAAILRSDPRERASAYDVDVRAMALAVERIIQRFSPATLNPNQGGTDG